MKLLFLVFLSIGFGLVAAAPAEELCASAVCKQSAEHFAKSMNQSADPCNDFYEFACGGWPTQYTIPASKSRTGTFDQLNLRMIEEVRGVLDQTTGTENANVSRAVNFAGYIYQRCLQAEKTDPKEGLKNLKQVVEYVLGRNWNIGQALKMKDEPWQTNFWRSYSYGVMSIVFSISVGPDPKNVTANTIHIFPAGLGLGDKDLKNLTSNPKLITAYKEYIGKAAKQFCEESCTILDRDIEDIVNFESELAKVKMSIEDQRDPDKTYSKPLIKDLNEQTKLDWLGELIVPALAVFGFPTTLNVNTSTVRVGDLNFLVKAVEILNRTPPRTVANYIGWRLVASHGPRASEQFRDFAFEFAKVSSGVQKKSERWEYCYGQANGHLSMAVSRLFVDKYYTEKEKAEAVILVDSIQESYRQLIESSQWLDAETKKNSLTKLAHVTKNVAYPNWLLNNDDLDELYTFGAELAHEVMNEKNYLMSLIKFNQNDLKVDMINLIFPVKPLDKRWPMPPAIVNAAYSGNQNSITIPAGILKFPFFSGERPYAINYGFIGVVIGHEFTHGLDDKGRKFDEKGNLHNWWTEEAVGRFQNRSQCFVQQYGSQQVEVHGQNLNLNGRNTLGENIADNGGLHEAYNAMQSRQAKSGPSPRLADLPKYSSEQLFFISYANTWCGLIRPEQLKQQVEYDPHSPGQYRVNIPLVNSENFAKAFNCPVGSRMNPKDKCLLW